MADQIISEYTNEGLSRLSKEKLMTLISTLQKMPAQLAMKVSEYIPDFFNMANETLKDFKSVHEAAAEQADKDAQVVFDAFSARRKRWETCFAEAKTSEEKERCAQKLDETDKEIEAFRTRLEKERAERNKTYQKSAFLLVCLSGAAIGITVKVGKHK